MDRSEQPSATRLPFPGKKAICPLAKPEAPIY